MENGDGNLTWVVPDGWLPPEGGSGDLVNHESLMILNTGLEEANIKLDIYFESQKAVKDLPFKIPAETVKAIRMDKPEELGYKLPRCTQYALRVRSDVKVVVQFGRMDVRQANLAYYGVMAYPKG